MISAAAQQNDSISRTYDLEQVTVTAPRIASDPLTLPVAITALDSALIQNQLQQNLSIKESLRAVPGIYIQNANNFAQDARISIRGFGATAPFGIRGIRLIIDGIPETTPDGQGQLDNLNLDLIRSIEVIRGASSSLYGNASGGVISVKTYDEIERSFIRSNSSLGSYGFYSQAITAGVKTQKGHLSTHFRAFGADGYRDHSGFRQINGRLSFRQQINDRLKWRVFSEVVNSPEAQDAGGLTLEETESDFRMARDRNLTFDAGEEITQWKTGVGLDGIIPNFGEFSTYGFYNLRVFDGRLPFEGGGVIDLDRTYLGQGSSLSYVSDDNTLKLGYDVFFQDDKRKRFDNLNGTTGAETLDQIERFNNVGIYVLDQLEIDQWTFNAGLRFDFNSLEVIDRFLDDGDDTGTLELNNVSYNVGLSYALSPSLSPFLQHSTSFETPTLNQLSNRTNNLGGFEDLEAATARNFEGGLKWRQHRWNGEIVTFFTRTQDELVPFELAEFPERTFFRNAGETNRTGMEVAGGYQTAQWRIQGTYTYSNFTYGDYVANDEDFDGQSLPGIPDHRFSAVVNWQPLNGLLLAADVEYVGNLFADDANETEIDGYFLTAMRIRYEGRIGKLVAAPYAAVNNLTNTRYFDNIRINAFGNRFYEPAALANVYAGLSLRF